MKSFLEETITAPATGPGEAGLAVIRISGPQSRAVLERYVALTRHGNSLWEARRLYHGHFCGQNGEHVDEVMAVFFPGPRSFTGEDSAEIHCHGGRLIVRRILDTLISSGVRLAQPGEFTRRAFLNGRLDLSRAEAVADLIHARSEGARRVAMGQLEGSLFRTVTTLRERVAESLALIEAFIDFDEDEVGLPDPAAISAIQQFLRAEFTRLIAGYEQGRIVRDGASLLILGRPNVGKSSLLNILVGEERAIVSDLPGTTRDTIEEGIVLAGVPLHVIDSAGIRHSEDAIEQQGVQRALSRLSRADLVLLVFDGSSGFLPEDAAILQRCSGRPVLLVRNKVDLPQQESLPLPALPLISFSCRGETGHTTLPLRVAELLLPELSTDSANDALICDLRHKEALVRALSSLDSFSSLMQDNAPLELAACELRATLAALGEITGETAPDEILERIFSRFCIGK